MPTVLSKKTEEQAKEAFEAYYRKANRLVDGFDHDPDMALSIAHLVQEEVERALNPHPTFYKEPRIYEKAQLDYSNLDQVPAEARVLLIKKWSDWFYEFVDSWSGELGMQLAYLFAAISKGNKIEADPKSELILCLGERVGDNELLTPDDDPIWHYIDIVDEDGKTFQPKDLR